MAWVTQVGVNTEPTQCRVQETHCKFKDTNGVKSKRWRKTSDAKRNHGRTEITRRILDKGGLNKNATKDKGDYWFHHDSGSAQGWAKQVSSCSCGKGRVENDDYNSRVN